MKYVLEMTGMCVALFSVGTILPEPHLAGQRALCDRSVDAVLTAKDLVEVTRSGMIVRQPGCSIGRRLAPGSL
jgi:hypothetical protein